MPNQSLPMILCDLQPIPYLPVKFTCNGIHSRGEFLYPPYPYLIPIFYLFSVPILLFLTTSPSDSLCTCTWLLPSCPLSSSQLPSPLSPLNSSTSALVIRSRLSKRAGGGSTGRGGEVRERKSRQATETKSGEKVKV